MKAVDRLQARMVTAYDVYRSIRRAVDHYGVRGEDVVDLREGMARAKEKFTDLAEEYCRELLRENDC